MPRPLLAHTPLTRLGAMNGADHATQVTAIAENALAAFDDGLEPDDLDRRDLARLLSAVGAAWTAALGSRRTRMLERYRWSEVCVLAQRIADRLDKEIALAEVASIPFAEIVEIDKTAWDEA